MRDYRPTQIELARKMLAQPDPTLSPARRALNERIARHVLKSCDIIRDRTVVRVPRCIFEAGLNNRRLDQRPEGAP